MKRTTAVLRLLLAGLVLSACNLAASPGNVEELTQEVTSGAPPTRTPQGTLNVPTTLPLTAVLPTRAASFPTPVVGLPPTAVAPPSQPNPQVPVSIVILSPIPGNTVAGNVQVLGSATHPQFLQYQLEYGPDPNPGNLWYAATGAVQQPVLNNLLGIWNTNAVQDGVYQLRLRVHLRDATSLSTVVNNIRIQNQAPTQPPSATPNIPRPIAAFTVNQNQGQAPLNVRFTNQSSGNITGFQWNFGDGTTSAEQSPQHTFNTPGLYNVTLTVAGPGGSSNVSTQINVQSPTAPVAGFSADKFNGPSPLTVQFTDTSAGVITSYHWNFSDGTGSTDRNPSHVFTIPGKYNVFLTVIGPGGSSSTLREVTVLGPTQTPLPTLTASLVPPPTATATATSPPAAEPVAGFTAASAGDLTVQFTDTSTTGDPGGLTGWEWHFGDGSTGSQQNPHHTYGGPGSYTVTLRVTDASGRTAETAQTVAVAAPLQPPVAGFTTSPAGDLTIQFVDASTSSAPGGLTGREWHFGDGGTSNEANPQHTFPGPGEYTVSLTVTDAGGSHTTSQQVSVAAPLSPPVAGFNASLAGDLTVQFTDTSSSTAPGGINAWEWSFGDGSASGEPNPLHVYPAGGSYTVTLRVTDAGGTNETSQTIEVPEPAVEEPGLQESTPILPDVNDHDIRNTLRAIYEAGQSLGNRATVFTVAGDDSAGHPAYLDPFNNAGNYTLDDGTSGLQDIIDWFNATDLGGVTSFNRASLATGSGWTVGDLLNPDRADASRCNPGETPLACELRLAQPAIVVISVGYHDVSQGTGVDDFRNRLQQVLQTAANAGVMPVLTTVQPRPDNPSGVRVINDAIIELADNANVPVYNLWRALNSLPNSGLNPDNSLSQGPGLPGDVTGGATSQYGMNARNRDVLTLLSSLRSVIFPDAALP